MAFHQGYQIYVTIGRAKKCGVTQADVLCIRHPTLGLIDHIHRVTNQFTTTLTTPTKIDSHTMSQSFLDTLVDDDVDFIFVNIGTNQIL
jgi:hypothetical protein